MQTLRRALKLVLPLAGMFVAFAGVAFFQSDIPRLASVLIGILLVEAGVWNLADPLLPKNRRYHALRAEVVAFLASVPRLNRVAVDARSSESPEDWKRVRELLGEMHGRVERIGEVAGKEDGMPDASPSQLGPSPLA